MSGVRCPMCGNAPKVFHVTKQINCYHCGYLGFVEIEDAEWEEVESKMEEEE